MGQSYSNCLQQFESNYKKVGKGEDLYFGNYETLQSSNQKNHFIHKTLTLLSSKQAEKFRSNFVKQHKVAFYVLYPQAVEFGESKGFCSDTETVHIFMKNQLISLRKKIEMDTKKFNSLVKEAQIWFILNEISRSLEILHQNNHPHLCLDPDYIYCNKNQNWFVFDTYYVHGPDFQGKIYVQNRLDFMRKKLRKNYLVSENMKNCLSKNTLELQTFLQQDIYCLGFSILYLMTMIPPNYLQAKEKVYSALKACSLSYSRKLIRLAQSMIEQVNNKRISLKSIRERLKHDEKNIINEEQQEYRKLIEGSRNRLITDYPRQQSQTFLSPPPPFPSLNSTTKTRVMYNSPSSDNHRSHEFYNPQPRYPQIFVEGSRQVRGFNFNSPSK